MPGLSKLHVFAKAGPGENLDRQARDLGRLLAARVDVVGAQAYVCDVRPNFGTVPMTAGDAPAFDLNFQVWTEAAFDAAADMVEDLLRGPCREVVIHGVAEKVIFDRSTVPPAEQYHFLSFGHWLDHLTPDQARARWDAHALLVPRVHGAVERYVQNHVLASRGEGIQAVAELVYPSLGALEQNFYTSPEAREEVRADIAGFIKSARMVVGRTPR